MNEIGTQLGLKFSDEMSISPAFQWGKADIGKFLLPGVARPVRLLVWGRLHLAPLSAGVSRQRARKRPMV